MNPEFRRNLWLEFTAARVVTLCGTLGALFVLAGLFDSHGLAGMVSIVALGAFIAVTVAWGGHLAGESVLDELRERTWDQQRMSALGPWSMTWGKLCGATSVAWMGGGLCLVVYLAGSRAPADPDHGLVAATCIAGAVFVQGLSLLGALTVARRAKRVKSVFGSRIAAAVLALGWAYLASVARGGDEIRWYGAAWSRLPFTVATLGMLAAWAVFGAYRMMCEELQVPTRPWGWLAFILYATGFAGGFVADRLDDPLRTLRILAGMGTIAACAGGYLAAFTLFRDPLVFRRFATYWRSGERRRAMEEIPVWAVSLVLGGLFAALASLLSLDAPLTVTRLESLGPTTLALWLFTLRDLCLLLTCSYGARPERAEVSTLVYLALLYWLVPAILKALGFARLSWLVLPPLFAAPYGAALVIAAQVAITASFLRARHVRQVAPRPCPQPPGATP